MKVLVEGHKYELSNFEKKKKKDKHYNLFKKNQLKKVLQN